MYMDIGTGLTGCFFCRFWLRSCKEEDLEAASCLGETLAVFDFLDCARIVADWHCLILATDWLVFG
ncbi:hypothetical protein DPMN_065658 [Dreissena polymorpha]|uniref:Uncharacterized protein n=1 Tax=Dreissena polymorpha TaxID=45954 RepID=A0A9D3YSK5_DREPO|nr:hypothetical protein DPMN_065658 [Dreissena polymorpha]